ncbi:hypothetical protein C8J56DRAFT_1173060 [Mycena floridula]|nr:hypothetical protein C8J56DRAFT_1173060 [Mycena floridula]
MRTASQEYELETVTGAKVTKAKAAGRSKSEAELYWTFNVQWKGYSSQENTWEPAENLKNSQDALKVFWRNADTGGRDHEDLTLFKVNEKIKRKSEEAGESLESSKKRTSSKKPLGLMTAQTRRSPAKASDAHSSKTFKMPSFKRKSVSIDTDDRAHKRHRGPNKGHDDTSMEGNAETANKEGTSMDIDANVDTPGIKDRFLGQKDQSGKEEDQGKSSKEKESSSTQDKVQSISLTPTAHQHVAPKAQHNVQVQPSYRIILPARPLPEIIPETEDEVDGLEDADEKEALEDDGETPGKQEKAEKDRKGESNKVADAVISEVTKITTEVQVQNKSNKEDGRLDESNTQTSVDERAVGKLLQNGDTKSDRNGAQESVREFEEGEIEDHEPPVTEEGEIFEQEVTVTARHHAYHSPLKNILVLSSSEDDSSTSSVPKVKPRMKSQAVQTDGLLCNYCGAHK